METRLLLVEDDDILKDMLLRWLSEPRERFFEVETAANGEDGLSRLAAFAPHLIVTDHLMPVMTGLEMIWRLKRDPNLSEHRHVPIVAMSSSLDVEIPAQLFRAGACTVLTKPLLPHDLHGAISAALGGIARENLMFPQKIPGIP